MPCRSRKRKSKKRYIHITKRKQMRGREYLILANVKPKTKIAYLEKRYKGRYDIIANKDVIIRKKKKYKRKKR